MTDLEKHALRFATKAHKGQVRKYTGEPYINHPIAVAAIVATVEHTPEMIAAAYLHDVVEDCGVSLAEVKERFGGKVATLVAYLSDISTPYHGNREARKSLDRQHIALAPTDAKTIKLADLIENTKTIAALDPNFWKVYRGEKQRLLEVLTDGDPALWAQAAAQCG